MAAQRAVSLNQNFSSSPDSEVQRDGASLLISVRILDREVFAKVWRTTGSDRNQFVLLDTDIPENNAEDRLITAELYRRRPGNANAARNHTRRWRR